MTAAAASLSIPELRRQWHQLQARSWTNGRQAAFTPLETALCALASRVVIHNRYGGNNAHLAPTPVPELAALFKRPPSSVLLKMRNIEGLRANGAKMDRAIGVLVLGDQDRTAEIYAAIMAEARAAGIGPDLLPDFLDLSDLGLVGQEEIEPHLEQVARDLLAHEEWPADRETERYAQQSLRIGQDKFARAVLRNYRYTCGFCELPDLLRASHIKPWRESNNSERLDPANGIAACPTHDAAFDRGLLMVNSGLRIHRKPIIVAAPPDPRGYAFGQPPLRERLVEPVRDAPGERYLAWHRAHVWEAA